MLLTIYDSKGKQRAEVAPDNSSTQQKEIQGDNVLTLTFTHYEHIAFEVNDYTDFEGERYWLMERYAPEQISEGEWKYDLKLYGVESLIKRFLVLETTDGHAEPVFTLTATPREHVAMIVKCINDGLNHTTDWKVGQVDGTNLIVVDYEGKYCDEALKEIAEKVGGQAEWWIEGQTVNVCRCEHGEEITLAYGRGLTDLSVDRSSNAKFYTRLFPIGSSRNIDATRYGNSRLMLPGGVKYVEKGVDEYGIIDHFEKDAFSSIYPRRIGEVSAVREEPARDEEGKPYTKYYFSDSALDFNPNDYELADMVKRVSFQDGDLAGMGESDDHYFEVNYNSKTQEFELITIWPYDDDTQLPGENLVPRVGDHYILWNVRMPDSYYRLAEKELLTAVNKFNEEHWQDIATYKAPTDYVWIESNKVSLFVGRRVRLESDKYFPDKGYRRSRITRITRKVNLPSSMDIDISDALQTGTLAKVTDSIAEVRNYTKDRLSGVGLPDIIRSWDETQPTDTNLFSARRSQKEFLSKLHNDRTHGKIAFEKGLTIGDYDSGNQGGCIDKDANAELLSLVVRELLRSANFTDGLDGDGWRLGLDNDGLANLTVDKLTIRQSLVALEMLIEQVRSVGGMLCVSAANGRIKSVEEQDGLYYITFEQKNTFRPGDLMRCQTWSGAHIKDYWVKVEMSDGDGVFVDKNEFDGAVPMEGDECVLMGNDSDQQRQNMILISVTEDGQPRVDVLDGVNGKSFANALRVRMGNLDGLRSDAFPLNNQPRGNGLYADNVFLKGTFLLQTGEDIKTRFEITEGKVESAVEGLRRDFISDKGYLNNGTFFDGMAKWNTQNEAVFFTIGNRWIWTNNNVLSEKGNSASVTKDAGRTVVLIRNKYICQKNGNLKSKPTFDTNARGEKLAVPVYLSFFYRCKTAGRLKVEFEHVDKTGFENFNSLYVEEDMEASETYRQYVCDGLWNGTGDFKLSFTGEIYLYMLVLSTDKVDSLAYKYRTLFEQSERLIKLSAAVYDKDERALQESGLMVKPEGSGIYMQTADGKLALIGVAMDQGGKTVIKLSGDNIQLEGAVTANGNFQIREDGSIEATNGKFSGELTGQSGTIGGFTIKEKQLSSTRDSSLVLGDDDFNARFQVVSANKNVLLNGAPNGYVEKEYKFLYKENRRLTLAGPNTVKYNWLNMFVGDVLDIKYYPNPNTTADHSNRYGYQYAGLGSGHYVSDGIVEGACLDVVTDFTANDQVAQLQTPLYCNRIAVSSNYDGDVLVLPDLKSVMVTVGCGIINDKTERPVSMRFSIMNTGSKTVYVAGYSTTAINGQQSLANDAFPRLYNANGNQVTSMKGYPVSPNKCVNLMLVYDGIHEYKALTI